MRQLLLPKLILPVRPAGELLEAHAVVIEDDRIEALMPAAEALDRFPEAERVELPSHLLMPGLINMHTHSPMSLMRGMADDVALESWLKDHIWPAENRWVGAEFVADGTELAMAEMLRGGTTCFNEMYFFPDVIAATADRVGMRAGIGLPVIEMSTPWATDVGSCLAKAREVHASLKDKDLLTATMAPHALYTVSDEVLADIAAISRDLDLPVYMHVLEIKWEIEHSERLYGKRPLQRLRDHGLLGPNFQAVHMVHVDARDIESLADTGTQVIHCPESNLKLASGICPVADLIKEGVNVSIGTDGAASNNNLDLLGEVRTAALLAKGFSGDPCVLDASTAIEMVTINAAKAMGLENRIGSIEQGKMADLCAIDLDHPETQPLHNVVSQLVYSASSRQFTDVWVAGRRLLENGALTSIDLERVMANAAAWNSRLGT
jgi:5-methylthioadenosine/S-adenosylhomocysteine deaminase